MKHSYILASVAALSLLAVCLLPVSRSVAEGPTEIEWLSFADGLAAAKESGRPLLVNFTASWCIYCKKMKKETYANPAVIAYVKERYTPVRVDTQKEPSLAAQYYVRSIPVIWFLTSEGQRITSLPGYVDPDNFLLVLDFIATESYHTMDFATFMKNRTGES